MSKCWRPTKWLIPRNICCIVEDEAPLREVVAERLADQGYDVVQAANGEEALERLAEFAFDIVITDLRLPGIDGGKVLEAAVARYPDIIGIVVTGYGTVKDAVEAIKRGAADFVTKPFQFDELLHVLDVGARAAAPEVGERVPAVAARAALQLRRASSAAAGRCAISSSCSRPCRRTSSTILITGETGTGKELVARAIHHNSPRRTSQFVALNCSAIPETLLEAELFGHVRGAFTGAVGNRVGPVRAGAQGHAASSTKWGRWAAPLQMKLLRALQEREVERVGDSRHDQGGRARHRGHQQRPRRGWSPRGGSARTCSTG